MKLGNFKKYIWKRKREMTGNANLRIALLIDAENVSEKYCESILEEVTANFGKVTYRRVYGDWTNTALSKWKDSVNSFALTPIHQFNTAKNKNSSDSTMIIDAMDILYSRNVDGFCLVSSDSDFTRLATRLREAGMFVLGMGEKKTPQSLKQSCTQFINLEVLSTRANVVAKSPAQAEEPSDDVMELLNKVYRIVDAISDEEGWANLADVGNTLVKQEPEFDARNYGAKTLSRLLKNYPQYIEFKTVRGSDSTALHYFIRFIKQYN